MQISVLQMEVQLVLELCLKDLKSFISGSCAHGRAVDFYVHSIRNPNAFPAVACTGTGSAFMGSALRFE